MTNRSNKTIEAEKLLKELERAARTKPFKTIYGVKVSDNHGATWKIKALCDDCIELVEPPTQVVKNGSAGVRFCDDCGCKNAMYET